MQFTSLFDLITLPGNFSFLSFVMDVFVCPPYGAAANQTINASTTVMPTKSGDTL